MMVTQVYETSYCWTEAIQTMLADKFLISNIEKDKTV